jgi:glycerophosphoryl diester phosphodiesterase
MRPLNIAHGGGAGLMPENTMAAFTDAMARGCDGAELDVQLSADGVAVVHHDFRLNSGYARKDGGWLENPAPRIKDLSLAQLQAFDLGRADPASDYARAHPYLKSVDGAHVPTLIEVRDAARAAPKPFLLFVELKSDDSDDSADPVVLADAALAMMKDDLERCIFVGFDWRALLRVKQKATAARVWFTTDQMQGDVRPIIDGIAASGASGWFPHFANATDEAVAHARERGLQVGAWTVNQPDDMRRLMGLDAICTDRPDVLAEVLRAEGK